MNSNILLEVKRIKEVMLLSEGPIGSYIRNAIDSVGNSIDTNDWVRYLKSNGIIDDAEESAMMIIRNSDDFFDETFKKINSLTDPAKIKSSVDHLTQMMGMKSDIDKAISDVISASDNTKRMQSIDNCTTQFNDPDIQKLVKKRLELETSKFQIPPKSIKGKISARMDDWSDFTTLELSRLEMTMLNRKWPLSQARIDIANYFSHMKNFFYRNERITNEAIDRISMKLKKVVEDYAGNNQSQLIQTYMDSIFKDINNIRIATKGIKSEDFMDWNNETFKWFTNELTGNGVDPTIVRKLTDSFKNADPFSEKTSWLKEFIDNDTHLSSLSKVFKMKKDTALGKFTEFTKTMVSMIFSFVIKGVPKLMKDYRKLIYKKGLPKAYAESIIAAFAIVKLATPLLVAVIYSLGSTSLLLFGSDRPKELSFFERFKTETINQFKVSLENLGISDFLWPWETYVDNIYRFVDRTSQGFIKMNKGWVENLNTFIKEFFSKAAEKTKKAKIPVNEYQNTEEGFKSFLRNKGIPFNSVLKNSKGLWVVDGVIEAPYGFEDLDKNGKGTFE